MQRKDPKFNVFVGQVGYWLPFDPTADDSIEAEYQEKQLNELMKNYKVNAEQRDMFYAEEKQKKIEEAIKENAKRKQENIEKGYVNPEKTPKENATGKIGELREIMDQKDALFRDVIDSSNVNGKAGGTQQAAIVSDQKTVNDTSKIKELDEISDPLGNNSGYSDPWMKRRVEGEKPVPPPSGSSEIMDHTGEDIVPEKNNDLDKVKSIFD